MRRRYNLRRERFMAIRRRRKKAVLPYGCSYTHPRHSVRLHGVDENLSRFLIRRLLWRTTKPRIKPRRVGMPGVGCRPPDVGCRMPVVDCRLSNVGCRLPDVECRLSIVGCRLPDVGCRMSVGRVVPTRRGGLGTSRPTRAAAARGGTAAGRPAGCEKTCNIFGRFRVK